MHKVSLAFALLGTSMPALAQIVCDPMPAQTIYTNNPWVGSFYYGNTTGNTLNLMFDLEVKGSAIVLNSFQTISYDQGVGNPVVPNQVGNFATVNIYRVAGTRTGNETNFAAWTQVGVGRMTIQASGVGYSQITNIVDPVTNGPVVLLNGTQGVCLELVPTNAVGTPTQTGPNAANVGPLHVLGRSPNPATTWEDQFVKLNNDGIAQNGWQFTGVGPGPFPLVPNPGIINGAQDSINIIMGYTPASADAGSVVYGAGCYERYRTAYESFPESLTPPDLVNPANAIGAGGGMTWIFTGSNYIVTPGAPAYVTSTSPNIAATTTYQSSSSASWDDAISAPYSFPATWSNGGFTHPAGVATQFCVSSNGRIYLANITNNSFAVCGAPYGSLVGLTDYPPSINCYNHDLDPTVGGSIHVDFGPANAWVRVTYNQVQEWGVAAAVNTMSVKMYDGGNVEIAYGNGQLGNRSLSNNAICGYFEGNMATIPGPVDWTALVTSALPQTGNGDFPPTLNLSARPVLGTTVNFLTDNITPGTLGGIFIVGLNSTPPQDLGVYGAPGCFGHVDIINGFVGASFLALNAQNQINIQLVIPNNPAFQATNFHAQTLTLLPGINQLGAQTTNGLCVNVGS